MKLLNLLKNITKSKKKGKEMTLKSIVSSYPVNSEYFRFEKNKNNITLYKKGWEKNIYPCENRRFKYIDTSKLEELGYKYVSEDFSNVYYEKI